MKNFVITLRENEKSVEAATECVKSAGKYGPIERAEVVLARLLSPSPRGQIRADQRIEPISQHSDPI